MLKELSKKYNDEGPERLGFILRSGEVVELPNSHDDPEQGARFLSDDLFEYLYSGNFDVVATWHTHPSATCNLSGEDYIAFNNNPQVEHYIVGNDGVAKYFVDEKGVVRRG